ncbi:MAG: hypothetical protein K6E71_10220 [Lachnospiraceae bacterium]|nr:hypothetical protein [Lachnospiraceae bacterium]
MEPTQTNIQAALDGIMHTNVKGTKRGELAGGTALIEPYCLVRDNDNLVGLLERIPWAVIYAKVWFVALIVEAILIIAYRKTYQKSLVVVDE